MAPLAKADARPGLANALDADRRPLTHRQAEILGFIVRFTREHGFAPTVREIAREHGLASHFTAECHLRALERRGAIVREHANGNAGCRARSIRVVVRALYRCPTCMDGWLPIESARCACPPEAS